MRWEWTQDPSHTTAPSWPLVRTTPIISDKWTSVHASFLKGGQQDPVKDRGKGNETLCTLQTSKPSGWKLHTLKNSFTTHDAFKWKTTVTNKELSGLSQTNLQSAQQSRNNFWK